MNVNRLQAGLALASIALIAWAASGCGTSAPSRFYTLDSTARSSAAQSAHYGVMVGPVTVPLAVDRNQFVVQVAPNRVEIDEFNRWAAPLAEGIARAVVGDLAVLLGTPDVVVAPFANFEPAYRVSINVQRFESVPGESALLDAVWAVRLLASGDTHSGRTVAREAVEGPSYDAIAAAHSRAIAVMAADIAKVIERAERAE